MNLLAAIACWCLSMPGVPVGLEPTAVTIHVTDAAARPAAGVRLGAHASRSVTEPGGDAWSLGFYAEQQITDAKTDTDGRCQVPLDAILYAEDDRVRPIIAWAPDR